MLLTYFLLQNSHCFMFLTFFFLVCTLALLPWFKNFACFQLSFDIFLHFIYIFVSVFFSVFLSHSYLFCSLYLPQFIFLFSLSTVSQRFSTVSLLPVPPATLLEVKSVPVSSFFQSSQNCFSFGERSHLLWSVDSLICFLICSHELHFYPLPTYHEGDGRKVL